VDGDGDLSDEKSEKKLNKFLGRRSQEGSRQLPLFPTYHSNCENLKKKKQSCRIIFCGFFNPVTLDDFGKKDKREIFHNEDTQM